MYSLLPDVPINFPSGEEMSLSEDLLDFFECTLGGFWETEEDVDTGSEVECAEDEVGLVGDAGETGRNGPCESEVEEPVGGGGDGDSFGTNSHGEDFGWVGP